MLITTSSSPANPRKRSLDKTVFYCEICPSHTFCGKRELERHKREKHDRTTLFRCPQSNCKRHLEGFDRKENCIRHVRLQHKNLGLHFLQDLRASSSESLDPACSTSVVDGFPDSNTKAPDDRGSGSDQADRTKRRRQDAEISQVVADGGLRKSRDDLREENERLRKELIELRSRYEERGDLLRLLSEAKR